MKSFYFEEKIQDLLARSKFISNYLDEINISNSDILNNVCKNIGNDTNTRITIIDYNGNVLGDSDKDPLSMDLHTGEFRQEIKLAKSTASYGSSVRFSETIQEQMMYLAYPYNINGQSIIIRTSLSINDLNKKINNLYLNLFLALLIISLATLLISYYLSRRLTAPIKNVENISYKYSKGDFSSRLNEFSVVEFNNLAKSLNKMASELDKLEGIRKEFVSNVSHELKTPITSIKGYIEILEDMIKDKSQRKYLKIMNTNSDRLNNIIDDLLILSRIENVDNTKGLKFKLAPLSNVIDSVVSECAALIDSKEIEIFVNCSNDILINQNSMMMHQALSNLLNNSIKYSQDKSKIYFIVEDTDSYTSIEVKDEGIGINPKHFERLFERFYRVDESRSRDIGGTGLGLAIVKHIILLHNGTIDVQSKEGYGTSFIIKIQKLT
ncbi:MAG: sensor histidine kinase [Candidatus Neomarinimicrobiota bacterium]